MRLAAGTSAEHRGSDTVKLRFGAHNAAPDRVGYQQLTVDGIAAGTNVCLR
jgi:hypothetical protein